MTTWFQVEFYSQMETRWVPLFAREKTREEAEKKAREWLVDAASRVVRVTQSTEVVWENKEAGQEDRYVDVRGGNGEVNAR